MRNYFLLTVLLSFISANIYAQKNVETQKLLWARINAGFQLDDKYSLSLEIEERVYWFPWRQHQFLIRGGTARKLGQGWKAGAGVSYFIQKLPHNPDAVVEITRTEIRPHLLLGYRQDLSSKWRIDHRYMSEFRIWETTKGNFDYENIRMRYMLGISFMPVDKITLKIYDELLINVGSKIKYNVFDHNRLGLVAGYKISKQIGFELSYINWFQERITGDDYFNRNIVRATIHLRFGR